MRNILVVSVVIFSVLACAPQMRSSGDHRNKGFFNFHHKFKATVSTVLRIRFATLTCWILDGEGPLNACRKRRAVDRTPLFIKEGPRLEPTAILQALPIVHSDTRDHDSLVSPSITELQGSLEEDSNRAGRSFAKMKSFVDLFFNPDVSWKQKAKGKFLFAHTKTLLLHSRVPVYHTAVFRCPPYDYLWPACSSVGQMKGMKGDKGMPGDKGDPGATGATGPKGDTGPIGPQGMKGDTGDTGMTGPAGPQGDKGMTGDMGDKGMDGAPGPQGDKGDVGPPGLNGMNGTKGDMGDKGMDGAKGDKGDTGATGATGPKGDTGATGPQGMKGDKGDLGMTGPAGPPGEKGMKGDAFLFPSQCEIQGVVLMCKGCTITNGTISCTNTTPGNSG